MIELNEAMRNHLLDGYDTAFGEGSVLELHDANGVALASVMLGDSIWLPAAGGRKELREPLSARATLVGNTTAYLLTSPTGYSESGEVSMPGGAGDMTLTDTQLVPGTLVTVHTFTKVA